MNEPYDTSWDLVKSEHGNQPCDRDAFECKYEEWQQRDWPVWLQANLTFPFNVNRMEDDDDAYFTDVAQYNPFRLGHTMKVVGIDVVEDDMYGIFLKVTEGRRKGRVPLADVEVTPKEDAEFLAGSRIRGVDGESIIGITLIAQILYL